MVKKKRENDYIHWQYNTQRCAFTVDTKLRQYQPSHSCITRP